MCTRTYIHLNLKYVSIYSYTLTHIVKYLCLECAYTHMLSLKVIISFDSPNNCLKKMNIAIIILFPLYRLKKPQR